MARDSDQLRLLHTTDAYKRAVLDLMVAEANWAAEQLQLPDQVPKVTDADLANSCVTSPSMGIGGCVSGAHYSFDFFRGKLHSICPRKRPQSLMLTNGAIQLPEQVTVLDAGEACALAKRWLCALYVDVQQLEKFGAANVFAVPRHHIPAALILVGWGSRLAVRLSELGRPSSGRPMIPSSNDTLFVELLGTTEALISLRINDPALLKRAPLALPNASVLLGPTPPPRHFVERVFGGTRGYETVAGPDHAEVWLLTSNFDDRGAREEKRDRTGAVALSPQDVRAFSDALLNFDTYEWRSGKGCIVDHGARLRFIRGDDAVEIHLCYECDILEVRFNGKEPYDPYRGQNFDHGHDALTKALLAVFPEDKIVQSIPIRRR